MRKLILSIALILAGTLGAAQESKVLIEPRKGTVLIKSEDPVLLSFELSFSGDKLADVKTVKPNSGMLAKMCRSFSCRRKPEIGPESKYNILDVNPDLLLKSIDAVREDVTEYLVPGKNRKIVCCNLLIAPYIMKLMAQELEETAEDKKSEIMEHRKKLANAIAARYKVQDPIQEQVDFFKNYLPVLDSIFFLDNNFSRCRVKKFSGPNRYTKYVLLNKCSRHDDFYDVLVLLEKFGISYKDVLIRRHDRAISQASARLSRASRKSLASRLPQPITAMIESYLDDSTHEGYLDVLSSHRRAISDFVSETRTRRPTLSDKAAREMLALVKRFIPNRSSQIGCLTELENQRLDQLSRIEREMDTFVARSQPRS